MKSAIHVSRKVEVSKEETAYFQRTTYRAPFSGKFDAECIRKALQPDYSGLYRPVTIDGVKEVSPGVVEWCLCFSIGD